MSAGQICGGPVYLAHAAPDAAPPHGRVCPRWQCSEAAGCLDPPPPTDRFRTRRKGPFRTTSIRNRILMSRSRGSVVLYSLVWVTRGEAIPDYSMRLGEDHGL